MGGTGEDGPRSAASLIGGALGLYRGYPLLLLTLAAAVVVPYELIVLAATGSGPFGGDAGGPGTGAALSLVEMVLVTPLVSALHVHAVADVRAGQAPRLGPVTRRGLAVLPQVAAASVMSGLGIGLGLVLLVVPGIYLALRWIVVAQAAAIEHEGWLPALRRSHLLASGHYWHVIVFAILLAVLLFAPALLLGLLFDADESAKAFPFLVGVALDVVVWSFGALATALLYFDLRVRGAHEVTAAPRPSHDIDPRRYADEDRPPGWYVDPSEPDRMRYWTGDEEPGWAPRTTRTPGKIRREWERR